MDKSYVSAKLSNRDRTVVAMMVIFASNYGKPPLTLSRVAALVDISTSYIEYLVPPLLQQGLLRSFRGPGGGYLLIKPPEAVSLLEILTATADAGRTDRDKDCDENGVAADLWHQMDRVLSLILSKISLEDVLTADFDKHPVIRRFWELYSMGETTSDDHGPA